MTKGAFQTSREIFENPIWQDVVKFRIFFYIVGNAVWAEEGIEISGIEIKRGQYLRSYRNLITDLEYIENRSIKKYSLSVISKKIDQLVNEKRLTIESTELGTLFTVVNYNEYQGFDRYKKDSENGKRTEKEQSENGTRTERERSENNNNNDNKDKKVKKVIKEYSSETLELTNHLIELMQMNNPKARIPDNLNNWHDAMDKIQRIDKYDYIQIRSIIDWCQSDSFWKSNILSATKLREKIGTLVLQMERNSVNKNKPLSQFEKMMQIAEQEGVVNNEPW